MFIKPFTKKLKEELQNCDNFRLVYDHHSNEMFIPSLGCKIFHLSFPFMVVTLADHPSESEGRIDLNLIEKLYIWPTLRAKYLKMKAIKEFNRI